MELSLEEIIKNNKNSKSPRIQTKRFSNNKSSGVGVRFNGRNEKSPRQPPRQAARQGPRKLLRQPPRQTPRQLPRQPSSLNRGNLNLGGKPIDARMKIIQKNRQRLTDARDKLVEKAKHTDARTKIKGRKMNNQNGRQNSRGRTNVRPNQKIAAKTPVVLQRSIRNNVADNLRDPSSMIRCTINRSASDFNHPYGEDMDIDEPISVRRYNNYSGIQVALKNEYPPYSHQEYIPNRNSYMGSYELPMMREIESSRYLHRDSEPRRMSMEMRARLDTPPRVQRPLSPSPQPQPLGYRIVVSNLHSSVTHEDIKELFEDIGPLLTSHLVRAGTAEVIYKYQKDAKKAVEAYHNRQLDGQPMKCLLVNARPTSSSPSGVMRSSSMLTQSKFPNSSRSMVVPDLSAIHKALFTNK